MKIIDLGLIISKLGLDVSFVAEQLFPQNKYPMLALNRVMEQETYLNEVQIAKLSAITGLTISDLFNKDRWIYCGAEDNIHRFEFGEYTAELNLSTWVTKLFHLKSLHHETILTKNTTSLSDYFNLLNTIIDYK